MGNKGDGTALCTHCNHLLAHGTQRNPARTHAQARAQSKHARTNERTMARMSIALALLGLSVALTGHCVYADVASISVNDAWGMLTGPTADDYVYVDVRTPFPRTLLHTRALLRFFTRSQSPVCSSSDQGSVDGWMDGGSDAPLSQQLAF